MSTNTSEAALIYEEPPIGTILNQAGLLLALNVVNVCLDKLLYCGLIGQLFIGILWGSPGAKWISSDLERIIQQLGYLGLIMLVYEGGLSMSIKALKANILVSIAVALTGILTPIALSFVLKELVSASSLQAFAAGAALSATSLGTTFTILSSTNLISTRLGTVTSCAAMLDDVVGLVMVQVIANLGGSDTSFDPITIIRPVFVSIGFAIGIFILCTFCFRPILKILLQNGNRMPKSMLIAQFAFLAHTAILVGMVAGATYAGTSSLFAAYLSGVIVKWFDELSSELRAQRMSARSAPHSTTNKGGRAAPQEQNFEGSARATDDTRTSTSSTFQENVDHCEENQIPTGDMIYEKYYKNPVDCILIPFFFHSDPKNEIKTSTTERKTDRRKSREASRLDRANTARLLNQSAQNMGSPTDKATSSLPHSDPASGSDTRLSLPPKPKSLYPPSILGLAMIARGEIGYLIASLAQSQGIFSNGTLKGSSDIYLVVIWAISLCTLVGPVAVGTLTKRVKKLQRLRVDSGGEDPLGVWGI
ncbi:sodium/hydrogen antiporter, putative [Talaromyces stipitatus ATCC 10500]|uniref:Sodium/hydrogen antiporter, putative n=1 Tax=Talaromyces stipitatus (strain ATCC 10500 / CBS 375.48 / QM 6759 / NRRL 1006) TaxID=441959 RepID=B8MRW0_TALSN|nr:sodium/hydrogen antiporter, putative [Talaromyces stipitatus ATCC 10500]EED13294.1 sodium/hydrogen antiporter, putative [Talaromyces stipitatus ATCC 10500]